MGATACRILYLPYLLSLPAFCQKEKKRSIRDPQFFLLAGRKTGGKTCVTVEVMIYYAYCRIVNTKRLIISGFVDGQISAGNHDFPLRAEKADHYSARERRSRLIRPACNTNQALKSQI